MAGNGDETDEAWLNQAFETLKGVTEAAIKVLAEAGPPADVAEAEKRARAAGVMARSAKAVMVLKASAKSLIQSLKKGADLSEDEEDMSKDHRDLTDAELAGLKSEFFARLDRLVSGLECKGEAEGVGGEPAARGAGRGAGVGAEAAAEP